MKTPPSALFKNQTAAAAGRRLGALLSTTLLVAVASLPAFAELQDYRYRVEVLATGIPQPMELEIAPDGRIFYNEISGALKVWKPELKTAVLCGTLTVFNQQENGFLGFALDPQFAKNQWIYCLYSPADFSGQRLSRFTLKGDTLDMASEKVVLSFEEQRLQCCHHAGSVEFDAQGNLLFSSGDNTNPFGSNGFSPSDERPDRFPWDAQRTSANTANLVGKIMRIRPTPEGGYTIPEGNLFPKDGSAGRPEIYVMGCRNPWRISVDRKSGHLYWGEVGPDARTNGERGPRGYDEINQARKAGFFGWPYFVGANFAYAKFDFATNTLGAEHNPAQPENLSVNNTGLKKLPPAQPAFIYWPYESSPEFPMLGTGGRTACAGPVFHHEASFDASGGFPKEYDGCLLFWDWQRPFLKWARLKPNGDLDQIEEFSQALSVVPDSVKDTDVKDAFIVRRPVDALFGADGCLYMLDYGSTWGANEDSKLLKISYIRGNLPPVVQARADVSHGRHPLKVHFNAEGTFKREGGSLRYAWRLQKDGPVVSEKPAFETTFDKPGTYTVQLTATDAAGASASKSIPIIVGNTAPRVQFESPRDGDFITPNQPLSYKIRIQDDEDGDSEKLADAMGLKVLTEAAWLKSSGKKNAEDPGLTLMKQSDCFNCHQTNQKLVGPALLDVAARYRGMAGALEASVQRVRNGSAGVWGEIPMLPHQQHTSDEIAQMVSWIYSLDPNKMDSTAQRGVRGEVPVPKDNSIQGAVLEASYTDNGAGPAAPLTGKASVHLRGRRVEAESSETTTGCKPVGGGGASGKKCLGSINHGSFAQFKNIPMDMVGGFKCRVASGGAGGKIEFRAGSAEGELLAECEVAPTGAWDKWVEVQAPLQKAAPAGHRADVLAVFVNPGKTNLLNLDWVQFDPPAKAR
jgi:cytochrome c